MKLLKIFKNILFSRITLAILLLLLQILFIIISFAFFNKYFAWIFSFFSIFSSIIVIIIINSKRNPSYKIAWIITLLIFQVFGVLTYIFYKLQFNIRYMRKKLKISNKELKKVLKQDNDTLAKLKKEDKNIYNLSTYLYTTSSYPIYNIDTIKYFDVGEKQFKDMLKELNNAEKFIFLEYFIIENGYMYNNILNILKKKASEGVEVRIMYDGFGSMLLQPRDYTKKLKELNINAKVFSKITPIISFHQNYRDHRKICIIDGKIAYTGGINIADEYINVKQRFGHWKDTGIKITGDAVNNFTMMFLELWNINKKINENNKYLNKEKNINSNGYVIPYSDNPLDEYEVGKRIYLDIINTAKNYVHIVSPYLVLDDEMLNALKYAALRGVDVNIVMPEIPDKKLVNCLSKSYYKELVEAGVKIFEYKYGFTHAKVFVSDNKKAVVGTINLDYRSLYLNFECACFICDNEIVNTIEKDFQDTLSKCHIITNNSIKKYNLGKRILGRILRFLAPLM